MKKKRIRSIGAGCVCLAGAIMYIIISISVWKDGKADYAIMAAGFCIALFFGGYHFLHGIEEK